MTSEQPSWERCGQDECIGIRLPTTIWCIAHAAEQAPDAFDAELKRISAEGTVDARGVVISAELLAQLRDATQRKDDRPTFVGALFDRASFQGTAGFAGARFQGRTEFAGARFYGAAWFAHASFQGVAGFAEANFHGGVLFDDATFHSDARFSRASFHDWAGFAEANFQGTAAFYEALFQGTASFSRASFQGRARFAEANFQGTAASGEPRSGHARRWSRRPRPGIACRDRSGLALEWRAGFRVSRRWRRCPLR